MNKIFLTLFFSIYSLTLFAAIDLSSEELDQLKLGKQVKRVKMIEGEIWPEVTIVSIIPYTPKQNVEIYSDFESHPKFVPDLLKCKVTKVEGNVSYLEAEMNLPWPLKNSTYSTRSTTIQVGESYELGWTFIKGNKMKNTVGLVQFSPYEGGKTLFSYTNHVTPDSKMARLFRDRVPLDVEKAVNAILKHLKETLDEGVVTASESSTKLK